MSGKRPFEVLPVDSFTFQIVGTDIVADCKVSLLHVDLAEFTEMHARSGFRFSVILHVAKSLIADDKSAFGVICDECFLHIANCI